MPDTTTAPGLHAGAWMQHALACSAVHLKQLHKPASRIADFTFVSLFDWNSFFSMSSHCVEGVLCGRLCQTL